MPSYGSEHFSELFTPRQLLVLFTLIKHIRRAHVEMLDQKMSKDRACAIATYFAMAFGRMVIAFNKFTRWEPRVQRTMAAIGDRQALKMVYDFSEINCLARTQGCLSFALEREVFCIRELAKVRNSAVVTRGNAEKLFYNDETFDAVVTDPPYYSSIYYADLSAFFYVWLKRIIGHLYPEHFALSTPPKRREAVAQPSEHDGDRDKAKEHYESLMRNSLAEARRVLKSGAPLVCVYAHKTTEGWATLIRALVDAGFTVTEAWPVQTESPRRMNTLGAAALSDSIFFVARRREEATTGLYETEVQPALHHIARERVVTLWARGKGIGGADLLMAAVGAGLRAYTKFGKVEYANGEPMSAEQYLREVEGVVLEVILDEIFGLRGAAVGSVDSITRFYILWRFTYRESSIEAGDAYVFCYPQGIEIDGPLGISGRPPSLVEKSRSKFRVRNYEERGENEKLGLSTEGLPAPLIDVLHRVLWLIDNRPTELSAFLKAASPNVEQLRLVTQALCAPVLGRAKVQDAVPTKELNALSKLTANWRSVVERAALSQEIRPIGKRSNRIYIILRRLQPMSAITTRPWLECVDLHPDVLSDEFSEDIFALDLGALSDYLIGQDLGMPKSELPRVPAVYRDSDSFFRASFLTSGLKSLIADVLGRLSGSQGNRVLKLVTPFGGGKSHTLAALLHGARSREALDTLPEAAGLPRPKRVRVATVDGQFFDPTVGKSLPGEEFSAKTIWGWIAWALAGMKGYDVVRKQDQARVAPGADEIIKLLKGGPSLILIDELLEYLISAGGIRVEKTTLRDETLSFLKHLTVAVGNVENAALVFSLQSSKRESLEYTSLLQIVEHLAARKDQRREPVEGNEILNVIQRRLLARPPGQDAVSRAANAHCDVFTQMRRAYAQSDTERQQAEEDGLVLRGRIRSSYPFHPDLIDIMRERWAAIPDFQRTRGALRFLASCLRSTHRAGHSRILLGPGDVPIQDGEVRLAFFKEVGQREDFQPCLEHDFVGANARTRRIDDRRALETTSEAGKRPATRLATTMLMSSFGGLRRSGGGDGDLLPPGISEVDLLRTCVGPDLDSTTVQACLKELKENCLYLHFDGTRYCFKKDPNITLLVEQEVDAVARDEGRIRTRIKELIEERLAGQRSALVWPSKSGDIPDKDAQFLIGYMPLEFVAKSEPDQRLAARDICENYGNRARDFRNGLGIAVPSSDQVEVLRRAVRYLLAIERVQGKWRQLNLTKAQKDQLKERKATEQSTTESALLKLYGDVWLPRSDNGSLSLETIRIGGRPLQTRLDEKKRAKIHQRLIELLVTAQRKVFTKVTAGKIVELFKLGEGDPAERGIATNKVVAGFYSFLGFPRLLSNEVVRKAIVRGVQTGLFGYTTGRPNLGDDGRYQLDWSRIAFERTVADDEIDLDSGFLIIPNALPKKPVVSTTTTTGGESGTGETDIVEAGEGGKTPGSIDEPPTGLGDENEVAISFIADRNDLFSAWNALANLADQAGEISISARANSDTGFDKSKLENGVLEPLRELGLINDEEG